MAQLDRTTSGQDKPERSSSPMATSTATRMQSPSPIRHRPLGRAATFSDLQHPLRHRRSSTFSESVDSAKQSIKSSTDGILFPKAHPAEIETSHETSHWHSFPIALILVPGVGGLLFENGAALCTDIALLFLSAIVLNWAVRTPWHWYLAARAIRVHDVDASNEDIPSDTIIEEEDEQEEVPSKPAIPNSANETSDPEPRQETKEQASAASELRLHEILALISCFVFPPAGAYMLHFIRAYLSRPSESLVSNSNLTIFILAAEIRPFSHVLRMIQTRTLHLQRIVATNPHLPPTRSSPPSLISDLQSRVSELENHIADQDADDGPSSKAQSTELIIQIRKNLQPDLDALTRAVRRYEKRQTIYTMQTEARLQELEKRMNDAITLAAAAERTSQSSRQRRSSGAGLIFNGITTVVTLPFQLLLTVLALPGKMVTSVLNLFEEYFGKKINTEMKTAGKSNGKAGSGNEKGKTKSRGQKKAM